jgi:hypothetical protein
MRERGEQRAYEDGMYGWLSGAAVQGRTLASEFEYTAH